MHIIIVCSLREISTDIPRRVFRTSFVMSGGLHLIADGNVFTPYLTGLGSACMVVLFGAAEAFADKGAATWLSFGGSIFFGERF